MLRLPNGSFFIAALAIIVILVIVILKIRKGRGVAVPKVEPPQPIKSHPVVSAGPSLSTGYEDLDVMLGGGIPMEFAVLILAESYDERDLLIRKAIESNVARGRSTFYMSADVSKTEDLAVNFQRNFYALNPLADKMGRRFQNITKIPDVGDLSNLSITSNEFIESHSDAQEGNLLIIDLLTDVLLRNKAVTTRKWLSEFIAKHKATHFTIIATLDPTVTSKEDSQTIIGVFEGVIEIYERELQERSRRFLVVKKMYGHDYSEDELMLDRHKLLEKTDHQ
jgi:KaiC/GvpD/RAD55 family RecA-like ATPase